MPAGHCLAVLNEPLEKVRGYAGVKTAVEAAGEQIDAGRSFHSVRMNKVNPGSSPG
jgi:hypothetical protein